MNNNLLNHIIDFGGHVFFSIVFCYLMIPTASLWILVLFSSTVGALREYIQILRGHPQEHWEQYADTLHWTIGSFIYYYLRKKGFLNADKPLQLLNV